MLIGGYAVIYYGYERSTNDLDVWLQPENENGERLDLGFTRKPQKGSDADETWVPLIKNVTSLEISYFDPGANNWLPRWPGGRVPSLIKITVGRADSAVPWETIVALRRTPYSQ